MLSASLTRSQIPEPIASSVPNGPGGNRGSGSLTSSAVQPLTESKISSNSGKIGVISHNVQPYQHPINISSRSLSASLLSTTQASKSPSTESASPGLKKSVNGSIKLSDFGTNNTENSVEKKPVQKDCKSCNGQCENCSFSDSCNIMDPEVFKIKLEEQEARRLTKEAELEKTKKIEQETKHKENERLSALEETINKMMNGVMTRMDSLETKNMGRREVEMAIDEKIAPILSILVSIAKQLPFHQGENQKDGENEQPIDEYKEEEVDEEEKNVDEIDVKRDAEAEYEVPENLNEVKTTEVAEIEQLVGKDQQKDDNDEEEDYGENISSKDEVLRETNKELSENIEEALRIANHYKELYEEQVKASKILQERCSLMLQTVKQKEEDMNESYNQISAVANEITKKADELAKIEENLNQREIAVKKMEDELLKSSKMENNSDAAAKSETTTTKEAEDEKKELKTIIEKMMAENSELSNELINVKDAYKQHKDVTVILNEVFDKFYEICRYVIPGIPAIKMDYKSPTSMAVPLQTLIKAFLQVTGEIVQEYKDKNEKPASAEEK